MGKKKKIPPHKSATPDDQGKDERYHLDVNERGGRPHNGIRNGKDWGRFLFYWGMNDIGLNDQASQPLRRVALATRLSPRVKAPIRRSQLCV